jgi:tRNA (adenine57-N1/adenine58-N1)-methyltransferase
MGIGNGKRVIEAGTGSGALTCALAWACEPHGKVYSYDYKQNQIDLSSKNLKRMNLENQVEFFQKDIGDGFNQDDVEAIFLDVNNPHDYLKHVRDSLQSGGHFGCIVPTTNQITILIDKLRYLGFVLIDVCEIIIRFYKAVPARFRPTDRMVAHTGYLVFARKIENTK